MSVSNKQIAEVLNYLSDEINKNVKFYSDLKPKYELLEKKNKSNLIELAKKLQELGFKIDRLERTPITPDLSNINKFYEEKTNENIKFINSRLKVPKTTVYFSLASVGLFLLSCAMVYFSYSTTFKTRNEIIALYRKELLKDFVILSKEDDQYFDHTIEWFNLNPKTKSEFLKWREKKTKNRK